MKTNVLLLCMCVCMFTQCNRAGNEVYIPEAGQEEVAATDAQGLGEIRADEPPQTPETPGLDNVYRQIDTSFDRIYEKAACLSPAKTGKAEDIAGKWKLALEINGNDTIDRSCEDIVYHFREDGTLTVSNRTEVCEFEYSGYPFCPSCYPSKNAQPNLKMDDAAIFCEVLLRKMFMYPQISFTDLGYMRPNHDFKTLFLRIE